MQMCCLLSDLVVDWIMNDMCPLLCSNVPSINLRTNTLISIRAHRHDDDDDDDDDRHYTDSCESISDVT